MTKLPKVGARKILGFTLMELMIAVAVIGILATIAIPSYQSYVIKSTRAVAKAQMLDIANRQPQFLAASRTYATKGQLEAAGYVLPTELAGRYSYDVTVDMAATPPNWTITFSATGAQSSDGNLVLKSDGTKTPASKW